MVIEAGRALVIAYNKWDLVDEDRRLRLDREIDRQLYTARWAPRVNVSAVTGRHLDRLVPALQTALAGWETRVPTGRLNSWLSELVAATPPPVRGGRQPKILFATQARHPATALRAVRHRLPGGQLPALRRAAAARGVRVQRQPRARRCGCARNGRAARPAGQAGPAGSVDASAATTGTGLPTREAAAWLWASWPGPGPVGVASMRSR